MTAHSGDRGAPKSTVEQQIFATGNFRDFFTSGNSLAGKFRKSGCRGPSQLVHPHNSRAEKFRESTEIHEYFLHANIGCSTVAFALHMSNHTTNTPVPKADFCIQNDYSLTLCMRAFPDGWMDRCYKVHYPPASL